MTNQSYRVSQSCPAHAMQGLFWSLDAIRFRPETRGLATWGNWVKSQVCRRRGGLESFAAIGLAYHLGISILHQIRGLRGLGWKPRYLSWGEGPLPCGIHIGSGALCSSGRATSLWVTRCRASWSSLGKEWSKGQGKEMGTTDSNDETSQSTSGSTGTGSHLPWHLIPSFDPGETDMTEYARRLEFLAGIWPAEHLNQLAPRAALQCKGSAFQKVVRIKPEQLKVNSTEGIKLLVTTLGGVWGKTVLEDKYGKFERAIYGVSQRSDESNESYVARHDVLFEDVLAQGATFNDMRAYILLRNSALSPEDKKRVIIEAQGNLRYDSHNCH